MTTPPESTETPASQESELSWPALFLRSALGGILMGLANLVPGVSGGTMLLAAGIYPRFIKAIADVTTLKLKLPSIAILGTVVLCALAGIVLLAGPVRDLVVYHRWIMYSLFIGLTLGGVPLVWKMLKKFNVAAGVGLTIGLIAMVGIAVVQVMGLGESGGSSSNWIMLMIAGIAGAGAMILPGVSGGYLLLVLGQYIPILDAIDQTKEALKVKDFFLLLDLGLFYILPIALGVVLGVVVVSQLLKFLLRKYEAFTLGLLLGLLLGAIAGLWPYSENVPLNEVKQVRGQDVMVIDRGYLLPDTGMAYIPGPNTPHPERFLLVEMKYYKTVEDLDSVLVYVEDGKSTKPVKRHYYPTRLSMPNLTQAVGGPLLIIAGFLMTLLLGLLSAKKDKVKQAPAESTET